jgi:membrane protein YqaA with SNARE-associated domain
MSALGRLSAWLQGLGPLGLLLAAGLDSFVPLAHVVDPMVILLSYSSGNPFLYAGAATAGSVLGTTVLFLLVRAGGEAFVAGRLPAERRARLERALGRHGAAAVVVGGILPPPFPFKAVVLLAGLARMPLSTFVAGVAAARAFRYGFEAALAVLYGEWVLRFMKDRYGRVALAAAALLIGLWLATRLLLRTRPPAALGPG